MISAPTVLRRLTGIATLACALAALATAAWGAEKMWPVEMNPGVGISLVPTHPAMASELLGISRPITYRARVDSGEFVVVFGFLERYWQDLGRRVMDIDVEGAPVKTVDINKLAGKNMPLFVDMTGKDTNGDGWLTITVRMHPGAADVNPTLNALWVFDRATWDSEKLTSGGVASGSGDGKSLYFVDCGVPGSEYTDLSIADEAAAIGDGIDGMESAVKTDAKISGMVSGDLSSLRQEFASVKQSIDAGRISSQRPGLRSLRGRFAQLRGRIESTLAERFGPAYRESAETRLCSPWAGFFRVRQEDKLRLNFSLYPHPASQDYNQHAPSAMRGNMDWIDVSIDSPAQRLSSKLGLKYNLSLKGIDYDPLSTVYRYAGGTVTTQVMDRPALSMYSENLDLDISFDKSKLTLKDGIWHGVLDSKGSPIYYGFVFRQGRGSVGPTAEGDRIHAHCKGFAVVWGDSWNAMASTARSLGDWGRAIRAAQKWASAKAGTMQTSGAPPMPALVELNQKALLSVQFLSGAMLAALDGGYVTTWVRDTTNATVFAAQAGDTQFLKRWAPYLMANASEVEANGRKYRSFFTFPGSSAEYGKKEQDGQFYGILTAYSYWKLTGDSSKLKDWYPILKSCMAYQRANYFDSTLGLYWETSVNEASLKSAPEWLAGERFPGLRIGDDWPLCNFGIYINNVMYASHLMLAEIAKEVGQTRDEARNLRMASDLAAAIDTHLWDKSHGYYVAGLGRMETGELRTIDWNYWDIYFDYVWAYTLFPMTPDPEKSLISLDAILHQREGVFPGTNNRMYFAPAFAHASYVYSTAGQQEKANICLKQVTSRALDLDHNAEMDATYAMKGAILENMGAPGMHRPEIFAIGPWLHAVLSQCAYKDFNGVTVVPCGSITSAKDLEFRRCILSVDTHGAKDPSGIALDGKAVLNTLRIPSALLTPGRHTVKLLPAKPGAIVLAHTDFELVNLTTEGRAIRYDLQGYGTGVLRFANDLSEQSVTVADPNGRPLKFRLWKADGGTRIQIDARGSFQVQVSF